jgi:hypothetical protein
MPAWSRAVPARCAARDLAARIKHFRSAAKVWKKKNRYYPQLENNCKFIIELFDSVEESRSLSGPERALREKARGALADSVARVAAIWKQRRKFKAIREGDENTKFFHAMASHRHRRNFIRVLDVDGVPTVEHADKAAALFGF